MTQITVNASQSYNIFIEHDILAKCGEILSSILNTKTLAIITDDIVNSLYADTVVTSLTNHGFKVCKFVFPNGENSKKHIRFKRNL
jgi:3-dehydroquinate synthase